MAHSKHADTLDDAIAWQLRLGSGDAGPADHAEFNRWLDDRPERAQVWERLQTLDEALGPAAPKAAREAIVQVQPRRTARRVGSSLAALTLAIGVGFVATQDAGPWPPLFADHRTGVGERRSVTLADGSRLQLNTRSAVDVHFDPHRRALRLRAGEVAIDTAQPAPGQAKDPRPFVVLTPHGQVQALGTRFLVRLEAQGAQLTVLQDAVAASPARCSGSAQPGSAVAPGCAAQRVVHQGQTALLQDGQVQPPVPASPDADAWRDGVLVFNNARLADVVAEFARHRAGHLGVHPSLAERRVSGTFPLADTDLALQALLRGLSSPVAPLRLRRFTPWWVDIEPGG